MRRYCGSRALVIALLIASSAACSAFARRPAIQRYMLVTTPPASPFPSSVHLELRAVGGSAPFHDTGIAYQTSPYRLDSYRFHRWVAPPTEMVAETLTDLIKQPATAGQKPASDPVMLLEARIKAFQQLDEGTRSAGLVEIEFCLLPSEPLARPQWCRTFRRETPASAATPEAAAQAISTSFSQIISELAAELSRQSATTKDPA